MMRRATSWTTRITMHKTMILVITLCSKGSVNGCKYQTIIAIMDMTYSVTRERTHIEISIFYAASNRSEKYYHNNISNNQSM
jgi:hypothetical protein